MTSTNALQKFTYRWSLRRKIIIGLITYQILLTLGVLANDFVVNERAEELVWNSSLKSEMDYLINRREVDSDYEWPNTDAMAMFALDKNNPRHAPLLALGPGLHDEFVFEGKKRVLLIRNIGEQSLVLLLHIDELEREEVKARNTIFIAAGVVSFILCILIAWAAGWLVRPLQELAQQIQQLTPDKQKQRLLLPNNSSTEIEVIVDAMNTYIQRNEQFLERERDFINMASHELRTPLSVIDGVVKLSLDEKNIPDNIKDRLTCVRGSISDVNEMIAILLVLAKDPARVQENSELIFLDQLILEIIKEHAFLASERNVEIKMEQLPACEITAPLQMVKCALGNLLRNAIENSHSGEIFISLDKDSTVTIQNTNKEMTMQEISEMYGRLARKSGRNGGGLGLELISRLCVHCNWNLHFLPDSETVTFSVKFT